MTAQITEAAILAKLDEIVSASPDHVYEIPGHMYNGDSCYYVHTDPDTREARSAGCLIGRVLNELGVPLEDLKTHEDEDATAVLKEFAPDVPGKTAALLNVVQLKQDSGHTWADALATAKEAHNA
jgi:hypothetical protein